jgi:hypothetical protein
MTHESLITKELSLSSSCSFSLSFRGYTKE